MASAELIPRHLLFKIGQGKEIRPVSFCLMQNDIVIEAFDVSYFRKSQLDGFAADSQHNGFRPVVELPVGAQR